MTETEIVECGNCAAEIVSGGDCSCLREYDRHAPFNGEVVAVDHYTLGVVYVVERTPAADPCDPPAEWRADPARLW